MFSKILNHLHLIDVVQGRNLDYVNQVQVIENFAALKNDLGAITKGQYVVELVDGFASVGGVCAAAAAASVTQRHRREGSRQENLILSILHSFRMGCI